MVSYQNQPRSTAGWRQVPALHRTAPGAHTQVPCLTQTLPSLMVQGSLLITSCFNPAYVSYCRFPSPGLQGLQPLFAYLSGPFSLLKLSRCVDQPLGASPFPFFTLSHLFLLAPLTEVFPSTCLQLSGPCFPGVSSAAESLP